ncbi:glutathione S-transferase family protein [Undibacterium sp. TJN19]|uniref:glutathione S-transferase family protein n=1 Tax=Undibacterium sp. TJN19 TaxID=3413055 RepID=UPI003BF1225D
MLEVSEMHNKIRLISHQLCPYVQRVAIVLAEKAIPFERIDIDLSNKPAWFLEISPLGKTPVLLVGEQAIFESSVICEYLEDVYRPRLHPHDAFIKARHRAWMEFASGVLSHIAVLYNAVDHQALENQLTELRQKFQQLEVQLGKVTGPYFSGEHFSMVDAAFGPVFRYFETINMFALFDETPKLLAWSKALALRASVKTAVSTDYSIKLRDFLIRRKSVLSTLLEAQVR